MHRAKGQFGSVELRAGGRELGHLHGDAVVDVPQHDSGWVSIPLETEDGVRDALLLLRGNYELVQADTARALGIPAGNLGYDRTGT